MTSIFTWSLLLTFTIFTLRVWEGLSVLGAQKRLPIQASPGPQASEKDSGGHAVQAHLRHQTAI